MGKEVDLFGGNGEKIFDGMLDPVAVIDTGYRFTWVNRAMAAFLGLPKEAIVGEACHSLVHRTGIPSEACPLSTFKENLRRETIEVEVPQRNLWLRVTVDPLFGADGERVGTIHIFSDITAAKRAEGEARVQYRRLELLNRIATSVLEASDLEAVLREVTQDSCRVLGLSRCAVHLFGKPDTLIEHAPPGVRPMGPEFCRFLIRRCGDASGEGRNVVVDDIRRCPAYEENREEIERVRLGAFVAIPLSARREPIGVLVLGTEEPHAWTQGEIATAEAAARQIAIGVRHAQVFRDQQEVAGRLVALVNNVPGIVYRGFRDWSITFIGADVQRITGHQAEEFTSGTLHWRDLIHPDDLDIVRNSFREAARIGRRVLRVEYRVRHKDGDYRWLADRRQHTYNADGSFAYVDGLLLDIHARKHAEAALRESEHRFRAIADSATDAIVSADSSGRILFFNHSAERQFGYAQDEVLGENVTVLIPPRYRIAHEQGLARHLGTGESRFIGKTVEVHGFRKDGTEFPVELSLATWNNDGSSCFTAIIRDITDRKRSEADARDTAETFRGLIQASPLAVFRLDVDGNVTLWSEPAERIFGWTEEEALHRRLPIVPEDKQEEFRRLLAIGRQGTSIAGAEVRRRRKDGSSIDISIWTSPLRDGEGNVVSIMALCADVTERKQIENALRHSEEQLRQSQKMEAVGRLAGGVAHDFNNLLTAIRGYSDLLLARIDRGSPLRRDVEEILKAGERASSLTRQLLAFSRKQVLQPKVLDLNAVVANMDRMLRRLIGEDIDLITILKPALWKVRVDPGQLEQVLMNLVVNARDALPGGGKVTIETANVRHGELYAENHPTVPPGPYAMLAVSDTGEGMDEETRSRLFEPFFTTKGKGKGTGLGLSTVYGIVKQSGGHIWVYSEPGRGTMFKVYFPRAAREAAEAEVDGADGPLPTGQETVLLVEDEDVVRELVRAILTENGYTVLAASNGAEALELWGRGGDGVHLVITDVVMPKMGGRELAESLTRQRAGLKVLYMSGYTDESIVHHGVLDPGIPFLQKPFTPDGLLRTVRTLLDAPSPA